MDTLTRRLIHGEGTPESSWRRWFARHPLVQCGMADLLEGSMAVHIVAPHPDDEILSCAGMIRQLSRLDAAIHIVAVTDGEASHPGSRKWPAGLLSRARARESQAALQSLPARARRTRLAIPDGAVTRHEDDLADRLVACFAAGDTVIAPWCLDGHPDHEAAGRAGHRASLVRGCRFLEVPIWGWHWADPAADAFPWSRAVAIALDAGDRQAKARAVRSFRSQLEPDPTTGQAPILPDFALARLQRPFEVVFR